MVDMDMHPHMLEAVSAGYAKHFENQAEQLEEASLRLPSTEAVEALEQARFFRTLADDMVTSDPDHL